MKNKQTNMGNIRTHHDKFNGHKICTDQNKYILIFTEEKHTKTNKTKYKIIIEYGIGINIFKNKKTKLEIKLLCAFYLFTIIFNSIHHIGHNHRFIRGNMTHFGTSMWNSQILISLGHANRCAGIVAIDISDTSCSNLNRHIR